MTNPTEFFYDDSISDEFCESILTLLGKEGQDNYAVIRGILISFIKKQKTFKNLQYFSVAKQIAGEFDASFDAIEGLIDTITIFLKSDRIYMIKLQEL